MVASVWRYNKKFQQEMLHKNRGPKCPLLAIVGFKHCVERRLSRAVFKKTCNSPGDLSSSNIIDFSLTIYDYVLELSTKGGILKTLLKL